MLNNWRQYLKVGVVPLNPLPWSVGRRKTSSDWRSLRELLKEDWGKIVSGFSHGEV